ncbi:hypothetical protein AWH51_08445 [Clavibacter tessellarius]|uniref:Uncharacterized protein n=1 Tax=Clavibacter tessellarius TaxID=31965 RepID=A0A154V1Y2_9MICO|nr:hypothetical protein AWH51_08445 [Clavibacter michiganensis subsp. tessellarius]
MAGSSPPRGGPADPDPDRGHGRTGLPPAVELAVQAVAEEEELDALGARHLPAAQDLVEDAGLDAALLDGEHDPIPGVAHRPSMVLLADSARVDRGHRLACLGMRDVPRTAELAADRAEDRAASVVMRLRAGAAPHDHRPPLRLASDRARRTVAPTRIHEEEERA